MVPCFYVLLACLACLISCRFDVNNEPVGFCASNIGMEIPTPCRPPKKGHDYDIYATTTYEYPVESDTHGNANAFNCTQATSNPNPENPFCCYYSPLTGADYCPRCEAMTQGEDWCGRSNTHCKQCNGQWCEHSESETPVSPSPITCCEWSTNSCGGCEATRIYDPV